MSEIYYALIILPVFFMIALAFIFSSSLSTVEQLSNRIECPFPAISGLWNSSGTIMYSGATYNYANVSSPVLTLTCTEIHTLNGHDYAYGSPTVSFAGTMFFVGDWLSELFANKVSAIFTLIITIVNAPAEVTGLAWFTYLNIFFILAIALGGFMILRGNG